MDLESSLSTMEIEPRSDYNYLGKIYGMEPHEFIQAGKGLMEYIVQFVSNLRSQPAVAKVTYGYLRPLLPERSPNKPEDWDKIIEDFDRFIRPGVQPKIHPRFVGYFPTGTSFPNILAETLIGVLSTLPYSQEAAPAGTELENICSDWMGEYFSLVDMEKCNVIFDFKAKALGIPDFFLFTSKKGGGTITPGGSDSIFIAILAARYNAIEKYKKKYPQMKRSEILGKLVMYFSTEAHSAVPKGANLALVNHRILSTDDRFRLRGSTLEKAVEADRENGLWPFMVVATIGTTSTATVDPIDEIGKVCKREDLYFHVDGSYGGCFLICPEFRNFSKGIEYADSFNINPHKNLLVSPGCSLLWVRNKKAHTNAFLVSAAFLEDENSTEVYDYRNWGIALTRRFRAVKLWFVMKKYGISGLQDHIRRNAATARTFEDLIRQDNRFEVFYDVQFSLVCIRLKGSDALNEKLFDMVRETHAVYLSDTTVKGQYVIRVSVDSLQANGDDMRTIYKVLSQQASELLDDSKPRENSGSGSNQKQEQGSGNPGGTYQIHKSENPDPSGSASLTRGIVGKTSSRPVTGDSSTGDLGRLKCPLD